MHMADALVSPAVGGAMWAATGVTAVYCAKKVREELDESKIPLMGVAGAFVFAAQMLNFQIPGTGSSGHLGGALILTALLGPHAAFLVMASVLGVQALFFADGGLLALGANAFNLGLLPAFVAFPLVYERIAGREPSTRRAFIAAVAGAVVGLQLGALGVALETSASGISELPFTTFAAVLLPVHLAIGMIEGLVTAAVIAFVRRAQPEILSSGAKDRPLAGPAMKRVLAGLTAAALLTGGALAWFASADPDGLEWSIAKVTGSDELAGAATGLHERLADFQARVAILPDYEFRRTPPAEERPSTGAPWPAVDAGTSTAGVVGAGVTLALAGALGVALRRRRVGAASRASDLRH